MARNLYRLYLYIIFIALVIFAVVVVAQLLSTLFEFTPLRGAFSNTPPPQAALVQSVVFAVIGLLVSGALGGLHYWLIRREQKQDGTAGESAIRSLFLNLTEAAGILVVVPLVGFGLIGNWAYANSSNVALVTGIALPTFLMVVLLELERRRIPIHAGAALIFQRLHFFGTQLILLFFLTSAFLSAFRPFTNLLLSGGNNICSGDFCPSYHIGGLATLLLWFIACWLVYSLLTGRDSSRVVRMIMHGVGLAFGIGWTLNGLFLALEVVLAPLFQTSRSFDNVLGLNAAYDFVSPLAVGILSTAIYHLLLRNIARRKLIGDMTLLLSEGTIAAVLLAVPFWVGGGSLLYNLLQTLAPAPTIPNGQSWLNALSLLLTGLAYIPLDLLIRRRFALDPTSALGSRRSLVLALLGAGILSFAIGGVVALYAWGTALLGSPLPNWPQIAHGGLATTIVGIVLIALYVWPLRGEHLLARSDKTDQPTPPEVSPAPTSIEDILDELLAGHISRAEAASRIRSLYGLTTLLV